MYACPVGLADRTGVVKIFACPSGAQALRAGGLFLNKIEHFAKVSS